MIIDLDKIQSMWEEDSKIDPDNLHSESLNASILHSKYFDIYNNILLLRKKAEQQKRNIRHEIFVMKGMSIILEKLTQKFTQKIHSPKKLGIRTPCRNIWMPMRNYPKFP